MTVRRRPTIGMDPLDAVVPRGTLQPNGHPVNLSTPAASPPSPSRMAKERLTVHVPLGLIDRVRNAVYWTPGLTLAELAERGLEEALEKLEAERGGPYPVRRSELKGGRPLK